MNKIISIPFSIIYIIVLVLLLVIFQPIQWICLNFFGYKAHKVSVDILNFFLQKSAYLIFSNYTVEGREKIPNNVPLIFVSNHQALFDIIAIIWFLRKWHPKFIAKIELGKGFPSISYNLKYGGSALINRKDPKQALPAIKILGEYIEKNKRSAVIFPEGTRSRNGEPKQFAENGLKILCKYAPNAYIVPLTINNSWKMLQYGSFPMGLGTKIKLTVHEPILVKDFTFNEIFEKTKSIIIRDIKN